jgi:hypothetical protein
MSGSSVAFNGGFSISNTPTSKIFDITIGSDGNLWSVSNSTTLSMFNLTTFATPSTFTMPYIGANIMAGPSNNLWITGGADIVVVDTTGTVIATYTNTYSVASLILASDGNLYGLGVYSSLPAMIQVTPSGVQAAFPIPPAMYSSTPVVNAGLSYPVQASDGSIWFGDSSPNNVIWSFTTAPVATDQVVMIV